MASPGPDYQNIDAPRARAGVGGWLLVLCLLLMVWQPVNVGLSASRVLDSLAFRGAPAVLVLALKLVVAALGVGAGLAMLGGRSGALTLARIALVAAAATDVFVDLTPYFPSNRVPGETPVVVAASLAYYGIWLVYLARSRRVRATFTDD